MENELINLNTNELNGLESSKAEQIRSTFEPMSKMIEGFEEAFNELITESTKEITKETTRKAKKLRLDVAKVRIQTEKVRKEQKEEFLRAGKAIDGVSNILKWAISDKENKLKEIETFFEVQEKQRLEELQRVRVEIISPYLEDANELDLSVYEEDLFDALLSMKKKEHEDRVEAARIAEEERIQKEKAEHEERERIKAENLQLKKEAEAKAKEDEKRKALEEAEQKKRQEQEEQTRKEHEAKLQDERKKREKAEAVERAKREKLEAELRQKEEAERIRNEQEEARVQSELNKGDEDKVKDLIQELSSIKSKYQFKSSKNKTLFLQVVTLIEKVIVHINK